MKMTLEDWHNGWYGVELGLEATEIDTLIELLRGIRADPERHFHATSDYKEAGGVGQVTFYIKSAGEQDNSSLTGSSMLPGETIPGGS